MEKWSIDLCAWKALLIFFLLMPNCNFEKNVFSQSGSSSESDRVAEKMMYPFFIRFSISH